MGELDRSIVKRPVVEGLRVPLYHPNRCTHENSVEQEVLRYRVVFQTEHATTYASL